MVNEIQNKSIEQIKKLEQFIPKKSKEEMAQILAYGEKMKAQGEKKRQKFWKNHNQEDFIKLLRYKWRNKEELEGKYDILDSMQGLEREKFIEEYLHDDMLYSGELDETEAEERTYSYEDLKKGNVVMEDGVTLSLSYHIGSDEVEAISKMKLKEGVTLELGGNEIGAKGAELIAKNMELKEGVILSLVSNGIGSEGTKSIAENMELKDGVTLDLGWNNIGDEGAIAIANNLKLEEGVTLELFANEIGPDGAESIAEKMELKEGVALDLSMNQIGDEGVKAIAENMELKDGVTLDLRRNKISEKMKKNIKEWEKSYHDRGINCRVEV